MGAAPAPLPASSGRNQCVLQRLHRQIYHQYEGQIRQIDQGHHQAGNHEECRWADYGHQLGKARQDAQGQG